MKKFLLYILTMTVIIIPTTAGAQEAVFTTFPSYSTDHSTWIVRDVNPGKNYVEYLTLQNLTEIPVTLEIAIIESSGDQNNIKLLENTAPQHAGLWIRPEPDTVTLQGGEKQQIRLSINVPANTTPGDYQAVAMISPKNHDDRQIKINTRIGNRIYLNVTESNQLYSNTFVPENHALQIGLIIASLGGIIYGFLPVKTAQQKTNI